MFMCPACGLGATLPRCEHCGHIFPSVDGIYELTGDPPINLDEARGARYIGYERVGAYYYDRGWASTACQPADLAMGGRIAELVGGGVLLDVGCRGGNYAVPTALHGCTVIAGDVSRVMLSLLQSKAEANRVPEGRIIPCRMNALAIPLAEASVDGVLASALLHLISDPAHVITEIRRVLRPGGRLMLTTNSPGVRFADPRQSVGGRPQETDRREENANARYLELEGDFDRRYWEILNEAGVHASYAGWKFDQFAACQAAFGNMTRVDIPFSASVSWTLADYFLHRMGGKGYSRQQSVPDDLHEKAFARVMAEFGETHGPDFASLRFVGRADGLQLHVFER